MFIDILIEKIKIMNNVSIVGLDPKLEYVPLFIRKKAYESYGNDLKGAAEAIWEFNKNIIDYIYDIVPAIKLQLAYYEMYGLEGLETFTKTIKYAKEKGLIVLADGKRNDIGSTAESYSSAFLGRTVLEDKTKAIFDVDALTINAYLGVDGVAPFIDDCIKYNKGIFILVKTSNPSSGQIQDETNQQGQKIYEVMSSYVNEWGSKLIGKYGYSSVGAVVGATYPEQAKIIRKIIKNSYILVPGYGIQGGKSSDLIEFFNEDGLGAIVNASRSIMCAYKSDLWRNIYNEEQFAEASRDEAIRMRDDINLVLIKR